jgi:thioredoxin 1
MGKTVKKTKTKLGPPSLSYELEVVTEIQYLVRSYMTDGRTDKNYTLLFVPQPAANHTMGASFNNASGRALALLLLFLGLCGNHAFVIGPATPLARRAPTVLASKATGEVIELPDGDDAFEERVLKSDGPVLIDFYARWCGPCTLIEPHIKKTAEKYKGKLEVIKVNTETRKELVKQYSIFGLPYLAIFNQGQIVASHEGAASAAQFEKLISEALPDLRIENS